MEWLTVTALAIGKAEERTRADAEKPDSMKAVTDFIAKRLEE
jgi:hypothetical protein